MSSLNTWFPGQSIYDFNDGVTRSLVRIPGDVGTATVLCESFSIPNAQAGFGITFDMVSPAFEITKPPKVSYASTSEMLFILKDADNWLWAAPCPMQTKVTERGWAWSQFVLHSVQDMTGTPPTDPTPGRIQAFQFSGAEGVHGDDPVVAQTISIAYIAGRSPVGTTVGDIRMVSILDNSPNAHSLKVGDVELLNGERKEIKYLGALPFGLQLNGPRSNLAVLPYRGPLIAGYQSGTPWVASGDNTQLAGMLDFMLESQNQFTQRSPQGLVGPWMHIYLQALWDCEQNGEIDTWVWDGPDGNPAWDGWQYRAYDSMGRTLAEAAETSLVSAENKEKLLLTVSRFGDWLYNWLVANPTAGGVPNDWRPAGWTQGIPLSPSSHLDPKYTHPSQHDISLALKGVIFSALGGYDDTKARYMIRRLLLALIPLQYTDPDNLDEMRGAFTTNPVGFEVYGFEQGEILEALALCLQHPELLPQVDD
jgi:hypothetical protein